MSPYRSASPYRSSPVTGYARLSHAGPHVSPLARPQPPFQLADFIRILAARRVLILGITAIVMLLAAATALLLPKSYSSSAVVMLDQRKNNVTDLSAVLSQLPADPATLQNQIQILTSRDVASQVIGRLKLYDDPEFNAILAPPGLVSQLDPRTWFSKPAAPDTQRIHDDIMEAFLKHVWADANGLSTAITVSASSEDAAKAQSIANMLAQVYVENQVATKRDANKGTADWLDKRTNDLARELMLEQQAVQEYKARNNLNDSAPNGSLVDQQMAAISTQIVAARSDLAAKQAAYSRVGPSAAAGNAADVSQVVASPLIVALRTQQADLIRQQADLSSKYGPLHPKLQALNAQKRDLDQKIAQEVTRLAGTMGNDVEAAKANIASLQQSLANTERQSQGQNMARVALQALQSNVDSTRTQYEAFVGRLRQIGDQDAVAAPESRIISSASLPLSATSPKRGLIVGASLPLGLLLGILTALLLERFGYLLPVRVNGARRATIVSPARPRVRKAKKALPAPAPAWNGPPILAELANAEKLGAASYVVDFPRSRYAQAMAALINQLDSSEPGASVVAVTSAVPGESKSAVAVSIARAAAQMGRRTVIVDCDPNQMAMRALRAPAKAGLYEVLTGAVPLSQALAKDTRSGVYALAMTRRPPSLSTMFNSAAMARLIEVLKEGADLVVLDCARAGAGPETAMLASLSDATLVVARKDSLGQTMLSKSVALLSGAHAAPLGIIATK